jgi:hypothetical protein
MEFEIGINETAGLKLFMKKQLGDNIREFQYSPQEYFILSLFYFSNFLHLCDINHSLEYGRWFLLHYMYCTEQHYMYCTEQTD